MGIELGLVKLANASKTAAANISKLTQKAGTQTLSKGLSKDVFERQIPKSVVEVYHSLLKNVVNGETLVSPNFGGCHGVAILQNGQLFFGHFPPFYSDKMKAAISQALTKFQKGQAKVVFVSPLSKSGAQESQFGEYLSLIKDKIGNNIKVETLTYPRKCGTYNYHGTIKDGDIVSLLRKN